MFLFLHGIVTTKVYYIRNYFHTWCHMSLIIPCDKIKPILLLFFQHGLSALMWASRNGYTEIVKYLVEAEASLNLQLWVKWPSNPYFFISLYSHNKGIAWSWCITSTGWWECPDVIITNEHTEIAKYLVDSRESFDLKSKLD